MGTGNFFMTQGRSMQQARNRKSSLSHFSVQAYCRDLEATALRRALTEAVRSRIAEYRA